MELKPMETTVAYAVVGYQGSAVYVTLNESKARAILGEYPGRVVEVEIREIRSKAAHGDQIIGELIEESKE